MKFRLPIIAAISFAAAFVAVAAHAETVVLPAGVFRMANGTYYRPSDGLVTADLAVILGQTTPSEMTTTSSTAVVPEVFALKRAILQGRAQLEELIRTDAAAIAAKPPVATEPDTRKITLAIWSPTTNLIRLVDAMKKGTELNVLTPNAGKITVIRSNGVNSQFTVGGGTGEVVVAIRYPIYSQVKSGTKTLYAAREVVYTPYSKGLHTPEMIALGKKWLNDTVDSVYDRLRAEGVKSRATPSALLVDVISKRFVQSIALIEHLDQNALHTNGQGNLEVFFVTLAANEDTSFNYSRSSAGALGLVQFIPSTYNSIAKWSSPSLMQDFEAGMRDPKNAIRAEAAYLDYLLSRFPAETRLANEARPELMEELVAAAYNGGLARVVKAMVVWDENLDATERLRVRTRSRLRLETMYYILKLRALRTLGPHVALAFSAN